MKSRPDSALGHEVLGEAATRQKQWSEAEQAFTEALRLEPSRVTAVVGLGYVALQSGDVKKAETRFRQALVAAPRLLTSL